MTQHVLKYTIQTLILGAALMFALSVGYLNAAWSNPGAGTVPTGNNAPTPINVSGTAQTKSGSLTTGTFTSTGNITSRGRNLYFGTGDQRLIGDNSSALYWDSNNSSYTQMIFRDKEDVIYGRIYGVSNGAYFGLLDGDGNWSYLATKDNYTDLRINNAVIVRLLSSGNVGIGYTNPRSKLEVAGTIRASQFCDRNGANCFTAASVASGGGLKECRSGIRYNFDFSWGPWVYTPWASAANGIQTSPATTRVVRGNGHNQGVQIRQECR